MNDLNRFIIAQQNCYPQVVKEIKKGQKESHWMWFIFPQLAGLGKSAMAEKYEIKDAEEAVAYLSAEILSKRLIELTSILAYEIKNKTEEQIFGFPDYLKFHSSLTLFSSVVNSNILFRDKKKFICFEDALLKYYKGKPDKKTLDILISKTNF